MDQGGVPQVVQPTILEDLGPSLKPDGLITKGNSSILLKELRGHDAKGTKEGPAGMDHLQLAIPVGEQQQ